MLLGNGGTGSIPTLKLFLPFHCKLHLAGIRQLLFGFNSLIFNNIFTWRDDFKLSRKDKLVAEKVLLSVPPWEPVNNKRGPRKRAPFFICVFRKGFEPICRQADRVRQICRTLDTPDEDSSGAVNASPPPVWHFLFTGIQIKIVFLEEPSPIF